MKYSGILSKFLIAGTVLWGLMLLLWMAIFQMPFHDFCATFAAQLSLPRYLRLTQAITHPTGSLIIEGFAWSMAATILWRKNGSTTKFLSIVSAAVATLFVIQLSLIQPFAICAVPGEMLPVPFEEAPFPVAMRHWAAMPHTLLFCFTKPLTAIACALALCTQKWNRAIPLALILWSTGILLGMAWSANSPGWGHMWNWDAVENLSLSVELLLLTLVADHFTDAPGTTFHRLKNITLFLSSVAVFWITFSVRSGFLRGSIHAFTGNASSSAIWMIALILWLTALIFLKHYSKVSENLPSNYPHIPAIRKTFFLLGISCVTFLFSSQCLLFFRNITLSSTAYDLYIGISVLAAMILLAIQVIKCHRFNIRQALFYALPLICLGTLAATATDRESNVLLPLDQEVSIHQQSWRFMGIQPNTFYSENHLNFFILKNNQNTVQPKLIYYNSQTSGSVDDNSCTWLYCDRLRVLQYRANEGVSVNILRENGRPIFWAAAIVLLIATSVATLRSSNTSQK